MKEERISFKALLFSLLGIFKEETKQEIIRWVASEDITHVRFPRNASDVRFRYDVHVELEKYEGTPTVEKNRKMLADGCFDIEPWWMYARRMKKKAVDCID